MKLTISLGIWADELTVAEVAVRRRIAEVLIRVRTRIGIRVMNLMITICRIKLACGIKTRFARPQVLWGTRKLGKTYTVQLVK